MRLMYLCKIHNTKFDINSYCKKWEADDYTKENAGSGCSTKMKCENCIHMPELKETMNEISRIWSGK